MKQRGETLGKDFIIMFKKDFLNTENLFENMITIGAKIWLICLKWLSMEDFLKFRMAFVQFEYPFFIFGFRNVV